jgi:hypothetical protein
LTAGVFRKRGGTGGGGAGGRETVCEWLQCLLKEHSVLNEAAWKRLSSLGLDVKLLLECLDELCPDVPKEHIPGLKQRIAHAMADDTKGHTHGGTGHTHAEPKAPKGVKARKAQTVADVKFGKAAAPKAAPAAVSPKKRRSAVDIKELREPRFQTMFTPLDLEKEEKKVAGKPENGRKRGGGGHGGHGGHDHH